MNILSSAFIKLITGKDSEPNAVTRTALTYFPLFLAIVAGLMGAVELFTGDVTHAILNGVVSALLVIVMRLAQDDQLRPAGNIFALSMIFTAAATTLSFDGIPYGLFAVAPAVALLLVMTTELITTLIALSLIGLTLSMSVWVNDHNSQDIVATSMLRGLWISLGCTFIAATVYRKGWESNLRMLRSANGRLVDKDRTLQKIQSTSKSVSFSYAETKDELLILDSNGQNIEIEQVSSTSVDDWPSVAMNKALRAHLTKIIKGISQSSVTVYDETVQIQEQWYRFVAERIEDEKHPGRFELIGIYSDITHIKGLESKLEHFAKYDEITGLMNRWFFWEKGNNLLESPNKKDMLYYMFLDLDGFKRVNDTSGHATGDKIIQIVGKLIKDTLPDESISSRMGGDEFCAIFQAQEDQDAYSIADSLRESISNAGYFWGVGNEIGASVGLVEIPSDASLEEAYSLSDMACMQAKRSGKNKVVLTHFDSKGPQTRQSRNRMINLIEKGLTQGGFSLYRQEVVPLRHELPHKKYEVLIRLRDEKGSLIPTAEFLSVAEGFGYIKRIDRWVVNQTIEYIENSNTEDEFWVNLSGLSVSDESFCQHLLQLVKLAQIRPGQLNFEITETVAIESSDVAAEMIRQLQQFGVRIALDDFGVGHASFANLRKLPIDVVKIDGSYVRNILDSEIDRVFTSTIIQNSHALGKQIVAEFVESQAIANALHEMGADFVQGFHFGRPQPFIEHTGSDIAGNE